MELSFSTKKSKVILIGISEYDNDINSNIHFDSIKPIKNNVEILKKIFENSEILGIPSFNIIQIENLNNDKVFSEIKKQLSEKWIETAIIYYAGHGYRVSPKHLYLTTSNSKKDNHLISTSGIEFSVLKSLIESCPAKQRLIIIDACYSGIATLDGEKLTESELKIEGTYIIASSPHNEQSFYSQKEDFTFFTKELINILKNGIENKPQLLSISDIYEQIKANLENKYPEPKQNNNLNAGTFYFAKNKNFDYNKLFNNAENYFNNNQFKEALDLYKILENYNSSNSIKQKIIDCETKIPKSPVPKIKYYKKIIVGVILIISIISLWTILIKPITHQERYKKTTIESGLPNISVVYDTVESKYGFMKLSDKSFIGTTLFDSVTPFINGFAGIYEKKTKHWGFINRIGKRIILYNYDSINYFNWNRAPVKIKKWGYIDTLGNVIIPFNYVYADVFQSYKKATVQDEGEEGYHEINIFGEKIDY